MSVIPSELSTRFRVGMFTLSGLVAIGLLSVLVNHKPYWWRHCNIQKIVVADATGLKSKSPIRSLGIDVGYLLSVSLEGSSVVLGVCLTAPIEIIPQTRAYIRGEGFLGDKFIELKPVKYTGDQSAINAMYVNEIRQDESVK